VASGGMGNADWALVDMVCVRRMVLLMERRRRRRLIGEDVVTHRGRLLVLEHMIVVLDSPVTGSPRPGAFFRYVSPRELIPDS
jgi:hypothetical protein